MGLKLMCVIAHPDDECFAFGGVLALAADAGVETYVVCLTDGQAATHRGDAGSAAELGRLRREEFHRSCAVLAVQRKELLDYADAQTEFADFSLAAGKLVERMRAFQPDVVVTFGADGSLNTHPDHTMVSALTTAAYHWAALDKRFPQLGPTHRARRLFHQSTDFFMPGRPAPMPLPWSVKLDVSSVLERKQEAFRQHRSQAPLLEQTRDMFAKHGRFEFYTLMAQGQPAPVGQLTGLFDGLAG